MLFSPEAVEAEYNRLGHTLGWRFLTCPLENQASKTLLVSLNPAGREIHGPSWSQELGSAYLVENWGGYQVGKSPLQVQVQLLAKRLGLDFGDILSAHFVPFRSPSWEELHRKEESVIFAKKLWREFYPRIKPSQVICIGHIVADQLKDLFGVTDLASYPAGWGNQRIRFGEGHEGLKLMSFPHLSRFTIFSSEKCQVALDTFFQTRVAN